MNDNIQVSPPILQFILSSSQIYYRSKIISFNEQDFSEFVKSLPPEWWNENDRIVYFSFHEDGTYFCEREKQVYDYVLKNKVKRVYEFNVFDDVKARDLFELFATFFEKLRLEYVKNQKESLRKTISENFDYIEFQFISVRNQMLQQSDWTQLPDVVASMDVKEAEMWVKYRKYLRDFTGSSDWKERNYLKVCYPITPTQILKEIPEITVNEYLQDKNHFDYLQTLAIASMINSMMKSLQLPSLSESLQQYTTDGEFKQLRYDDYNDVMNIINQTLNLIDPTLKLEIRIVDVT